MTGFGGGTWGGLRLKTCGCGVDEVEVLLVGGVNAGGGTGRKDEVVDCVLEDKADAEEPG